MKEPTDFNEFLDSLLLCIADEQRNQSVQSSDLHAICKAQHWTVAPTWIEMAGPELKKRGFGLSLANGRESYFHINGSGVAHAADVRTARSPSVSDVLASDKVQKISSLGVSVTSLLMSVAALIVAVLAYVKE